MVPLEGGMGVWLCGLLEGRVGFGCVDPWREGWVLSFGPLEGGVGVWSCGLLMEGWGVVM